MAADKASASGDEVGPLACRAAEHAARFPVRLVVFDLDRTLNVNGLHWPSLESADQAKALLCSTKAFDDDRSDFWKRERLRDWYTHRNFVGVDRIKALDEMLTSLRESGGQMKLTVLTYNTGGAAYAYNVLASIGLAHHFDVIWSAPRRSQAHILCDGPVWSAAQGRDGSWSVMTDEPLMWYEFSSSPAGFEAALPDKGGLLERLAATGAENSDLLGLEDLCFDEIVLADDSERHLERMTRAVHVRDSMEPESGLGVPRQEDYAELLSCLFGFMESHAMRR